MKHQSAKLMIAIAVMGLLIGCASKGKGKEGPGNPAQEAAEKAEREAKEAAKKKSEEEKKAANELKKKMDEAMAKVDEMNNGNGNGIPDPAPVTVSLPVNDGKGLFVARQPVEKLNFARPIAADNGALVGIERRGAGPARAISSETTHGQPRI